MLKGPPAWTLKHGQFLIMGGILLVEPVDVDVKMEIDKQTGPLDEEKGPASSEPRETILTLEMLVELVKDPGFEIQITAEEIADRSKGDTLSKTIFILQTSWFIFQCIARHVQGLSITQLELTTLALASLNGITLLLWLDKPLGVETPARVEMKRLLTEKEREAGVSKSIR